MSELDPSARSEPDDGEDSYLASLSDLMVGMLFIFIIMLMAFALSYTNATNAANAQSRALQCLLTKNQQRVEVLLAKIGSNANRRLGNSVGIEVDKNSQALRMKDSGLFNTGSSALLPQGQLTIHALAQELNQLEGAEEIIDAVYVEGHTDNDPIIGGSNWVLSAQRAINTYQELILTNDKLDKMQNASGQKLFAVSGYGEWRPIANNSTVAGKNMNRRIDIRLALRVPTSGEVQKAMDNPLNNNDGCKVPDASK